MAVWSFAAAIIESRPIRLFNGGNLRRDFTYIDDVVEAVIRLIDAPPRGDPGWSGDAPDPVNEQRALARL